MKSLDQIYFKEDEEIEASRPRRKIFEPVTRYDYCLVIANIIEKPIGYVLKKTKGWPMDWFFQIQSECKMIRDTDLQSAKIGKAKFISWFIREAELKNIK